MAGPATEVQVQTQWKAAVDILETFRVHADDTLVKSDGTGKLAVLEDALKGQFTPGAMSAAADNFREGLSALLSPALVRSFLDPVFQEYGKVIDGDVGGDTFGGGYATVDQILEALYEFFIANTISIETRGITFDAAPAITAGGIGDGVLTRLTVDENNREIEACTVEKKHFRCRADQNSGTEKYAEVFEVLGQQLSKDNLLKGTTGRGPGTGETITSRHAGGGDDGGSLLDNGSFNTFDDDNSPEKFSSWDEVFAGGATAAAVGQDTVNTYRGVPGEEDADQGSLELTLGNAAHTVTLRQTLENLTSGSLRRDRPYLLRAMVRKDTGVTAVGGSFWLRLGSQALETTIVSIGAGWQEIIMPVGQNSWFNNFNQDKADGGMVEVEWTGGTTGTLLIDDMVLHEMDLIDGLYHSLRLNDAAPTAWLVDDEITLTDTFDVGFGNGKLQYYTQLGYGRYLPHLGSPTITDP